MFKQQKKQHFQKKINNEWHIRFCIFFFIVCIFKNKHANNKTQISIQMRDIIENKYPKTYAEREKMFEKEIEEAKKYYSEIRNRTNEEWSLEREEREKEDKKRREEAAIEHIHRWLQAFRIAEKERKENIEREKEKKRQEYIERIEQENQRRKERGLIYQYKRTHNKKKQHKKNKDV